LFSPFFDQRRQLYLTLGAICQPFSQVDAFHDLTCPAALAYDGAGSQGQLHRVMYTCRECEREINQATEICPYCGADLTVPGLEAQEPVKKRSLASILLIWSVLAVSIGAGLWGFVRYILPGPKGDAALRAEMQAVEALTEMRAALAAYAGAQGGTYPVSLEALGDRARAPAQKALSEGYQVQYIPGPVGPGGAVHNYVLLARPGNYGYRSFYTDETGVLRATWENRAATAQDLPI